MIGTISREFFLLLARSKALKQAASRYGIRRETSFARRFIAGESIEDAISAARSVEALGTTNTLDYLGESVSHWTAAEAASREYLRIMDRVVAASIGRNISLKLTQLGLDIDPATCIDNLRRVLEAASPAGFFVWIDMESSRYTELTLEIFDTVWHGGYRHVGAVLQSALRRSEADLHRLNRLRARVRLVKGAYQEPKSVAFQKKSEVDAAFRRMMETLLLEGTCPAIATHDPALLNATRRFAQAHDIAPDRFEFQMLYGVRRDLQRRLVQEGFRLRIYIPFGREWFPYVMRRLAERPANVGFVLRSTLSERFSSHDR